MRTASTYFSVKENEKYNIEHAGKFENQRNVFSDQIRSEDLEFNELINAGFDGYFSDYEGVILNKEKIVSLKPVYYAKSGMWLISDVIKEVIFMYILDHS